MFAFLEYPMKCDSVHFSLHHDMAWDDNVGVMMSVFLQSKGCHIILSSLVTLLKGEVGQTLKADEYLLKLSPTSIALIWSCAWNSI